MKKIIFILYIFFIVIIGGTWQANHKAITQAATGDTWCTAEWIPGGSIVSGNASAFKFDSGNAEHAFGNTYIDCTGALIWSTPNSGETGSYPFRLNNTGVATCTVHVPDRYVQGKWVNCSASINVMGSVAPSNGVCGSSNSGNFNTAPSTNLCASGVASTLTGTGPWSWTCTGVGGGTSANCAALKTSSSVVNGLCGTSNHKPSYAKPSSGLCSTGTASAVTGTTPGPWNWTCSGSAGGTSENCIAEKIETVINGACGLSSGKIFETAPSANLCMMGIPSTVSISDSSSWSWTCDGVGGGTSANCSAFKKVDVVCTAWSYGVWSTCTNGVQIRQSVPLAPVNCSGGNPITKQSCTANTVAVSTNNITSSTTNTVIENKNSNSTTNTVTKNKNSKQDDDNDGLFNDLEIALGTNLQETDTDGDGYSDKEELSANYNPLGAGKLNIDKFFASAQKGKIFLQVENKGEAWYINPADNKRYFLSRPSDAFAIMRKFAMGVKHKFVTDHTGKVFESEYRGKIILDVEDKGRAYYINVNDGRGYSLGSPVEAFKIMKKLGFGISNKNISRIELGFISGGTSKSTNGDASEIIRLEQKPTSLQLLSQADVTPTDKSVYRPDVTAINGELWLAYNSSNGPMLQRLDASLNKIGQAITLQSATEKATDIRIDSADGQFWMAYESVLLPEIACDEHFLNIASYTGYPPQISKSAFHIAKGCALNRKFMENPIGLPANPEIVDDPTPFYHKGTHYVLTRAWGWNKTSSIHHLRKLKADMTIAEDILLDTSKVVSGRQMSQSALLHIDGKPFLIAGFPSGMWVDSNTSNLYIIQLSDDLRSFSGEAIRLPVTNTKFPTRITRARYINGTLIINFNDTFVFPGTGYKTSEYLALFDVSSGFSLLSQLQTHDHQVEDNHSSFEILGDKLYLFQQQDGKKISAKIFKLKSPSSDSM